MDLGLTDKVALVLGSTSGLGRASAVALAEAGAKVAVVGRRTALVDDLAATLPGAHGVTADLTEPGAAERVLAEVREGLGEVDVLVLNGGGPPPGTAEEFTPAKAQAAIDLLLTQQVALAHAVVPGMRQRGWGRVLAVGSSGVQQPIAALTASNVGRAALAAYLKTLAGAVARDGVTVNMVLPGRIATDRLASLDVAAAERAGTTVEQVEESWRELVPAGRYGDPAEFGAVVAFLASRQAAYVTGEQVRVDGGLVGGY